MALPRLSGLARYRSAFAEMSNYAVQSRYPDDLVELTRDDVVGSLKIAEGSPRNREGKALKSAHGLKKQ